MIRSRSGSHGEARLASQLRDPHTMTIYDYGVESGIYYIVMELLEGITLKRLIKRHGPIEPERAARLIGQVLTSLEEAHHCSVLHRDLKPTNIMITTDYRGREHIKVVDFGIAKTLQIERDGGVQDITEKKEEDITQEASFIGTPRYAAPEQLFAQNLSPMTDIYSVGLILWEMLQGRPAIAASSWYECCRFHLDHRDEPLQMPATSGVPDELKAIVDRAVIRRAPRRWRSARAMRAALDGWSAGAQTEAPSVEERDSETPALGRASSSRALIDPNLDGADVFMLKTEQGAREPWHGDASKVTALDEDADPLSTLWDEALAGDEAPSFGATAASSPRDEKPGRRAVKLPERSLHEDVGALPEVDEEAARATRHAPREEAGARATKRSPIKRRTWRDRRRGRRITGALVVVAIAVAGVVGWTMFRGDEGAPAQVPAVVADVIEPLVEPSPKVEPISLFSRDGILLVIKSAGWATRSEQEALDLSSFAQKSYIFQRGKARMDVTIYTLYKAQSIEELQQNVRGSERLVVLDSKAIKLSPINDAGRVEVGELFERLMGYKRAVHAKDREQREAAQGEQP